MHLDKLVNVKVYPPFIEVRGVGECATLLFPLKFNIIMESVAVFMCKKIVGISIAVFFSALLIPFSVYADDDDYDDINYTDVTTVSEVIASYEEDSESSLLIDSVEVEPEAFSVTEMEIVLDDVAVHATDDLLSVLSDQSINYDPDLPDLIYDHIVNYVHDENTDYEVEIIRSDLHDLIVSHIDDAALYSEDVEKSVDKVYDDIFVVVSDQQDLTFFLAVIIALLSSILLLFFFSYFCR